MNKIQLSGILEAPIISEKTTRSADKEHRVAFRVRKSATKQQVKRATELMFSVEVETVQLLNVKGKIKRQGRFQGVRSDWKKAYVKLKPGYDIDFSPA